MSCLKIKLKTLLICIAIPLLVGALAGFISSGSMSDFMMLNKPPLSPPGWIFPVVWTILYIFMGVASYIVVTSKAPSDSINNAMKLYFVQLLFNFLWSILFFNLNLYFISFIWLVILWLLIIATIKAFSQISKLAAYFMLPYLLWVSFAGYLNLAIAFLN